MEDFFNYSLLALLTIPSALTFYRPWTFLPHDASLKNYYEKDGEALYKEYQKEVTAYWKKHTKKKFLLEGNPERLRLKYFSYLH